MTNPTAGGEGTRDLRGLRLVAVGRRSGGAIAQRIRQVSRGVLQVQKGALSPPLPRLEQQGWIEAEWGESENRRRAKFYSLTGPGRAYLEAERVNWRRLSAAIDLVLEGS